MALARREMAGIQEQAVYLSEREMNVGRLLALGHTNTEIAGILIVSVRTRRDRAHLFRKLGVHTRAELVPRCGRYSSTSRRRSDQE